MFDKNATKEKDSLINTNSLWKYALVPATTELLRHMYILFLLCALLTVLQREMHPKATLNSSSRSAATKEDIKPRGKRL